MLVWIIAIPACYYDSEENLYPSSICKTSHLSYQQNIKPILERNCYVCHNDAVNTSNITLEGYDQLLVYVNSGNLLGAIRHEDGFMAMPQGAPKLTSCEISKIQQWVIEGAPNN